MKEIVTASGPVCVIDCSVGLMTTPVSTECGCASKLVNKAAPLQGVPSWKARFGFSVTVHAVYEAFGTTDWAR